MLKHQRTSIILWLHRALLGEKKVFQILFIEMKKIQEFLTLKKHRGKTLLVTAPLTRKPRAIDTVYTAIRLCQTKFHIVLNRMPLIGSSLIDCPYDTPICVIIDSEDILDNRWAHNAKTRKQFKVIVVHHDRYETRIRKFREYKHTIEVRLQATNDKSPYHVLDVLSSVDCRKTLSERVHYLQTHPCSVAWVRENLPLLAHNVDHLHVLLDMGSVADLMPIHSDELAIVFPLMVGQRRGKVQWMVPKLQGV